jgi:hypothetical protein
MQHHFSLACLQFFLGDLLQLRNISLQTIFSAVTFFEGGTQWCSWLRHCITSQKVAGSIPNGVIDIIPSGRTLALGSRQPLTEMSTRNISWEGKGGWCVRLRTLPPLCADCLEILGASTSQSPKGLSRPVMGLFYLTFFEKWGSLKLQLSVLYVDQVFPTAGTYTGCFIGEFLWYNEVGAVRPLFLSYPNDHQ